MTGDEVRPPLVTVVVPARDEELSITACLRAVLAQDYPPDRLEVLVVDGGSTDGTAGAGRSALAGATIAHGAVLSNPLGSTPTSLNLGVRDARGEILCRVDARSFIPPHYVRRCVELLAEPTRAVVGGAQVARAAPGAPLVARGIARALRNPWVTGGARYRRGASVPADTVYLGAFRTADLRAAGGWDARFSTNQDYELNRRMSRRGLIWSSPDLVVEYRPRSSLADVARQYRRFGRWKAAAWFEGGVRIAPRQVGLLVAPAVAATVGIRAARRRPVALTASVAMGAVLSDMLVREPAPLPDRLASVVASGTIVGSWIGGMVEGALRHLTGDRLLAPVEPQGSGSR